MFPFQILPQLFERIHAFHIFTKREKHGEYGFFHQNLRDVLAAIDVINELVVATHKSSAKRSLRKYKIPDLFREEIHIDIRRYVGELLLEHLNIAKFDQTSNWSKAHWAKTPLHHFADTLRGAYNKKRLGKALWNIVTIWVDARNGDLAGEDLSHLWLEGINFHQTILSKRGKDGYLAANFYKSRMYYKQFLGDDYGKIQGIDIDKFDNILCVTYEKKQMRYNLSTGSENEYTIPLIEERGQNNDYPYEQGRRKIFSQSDLFILTVSGRAFSNFDYYYDEYVNRDGFLQRVKSETTNGILNDFYGYSGNKYYLNFYKKTLDGISISSKLAIHSSEKFIISPDLKKVVYTFCKQGEYKHLAKHERVFLPEIDTWYLKIFYQESGLEVEIPFQFQVVPICFHPKSNKIAAVTGKDQIVEIDLSNLKIHVLEGRTVEELPFSYSHCKVVMKKMCVFSGNPKTVENLV